MRPGDAPALISEARGSVSLVPLMITTPPVDDGPDIPCEAKTRVVIPLGGLVMLTALLQETKLKAVAKIAYKRVFLFKRQAPNCRKTIDLCVK
jgi:hypothetical protein